MKSEVQKKSVILIMPLFFHLFTIKNCQGDLFNKLYMQSDFTNISLLIHQVNLVEGRS